MRLEHKKKYLQIALNSSFSEAREILFNLPVSDRILIEAGTPLIKSEGANVIREIKFLKPYSYIVADLKIMNLAKKEVILAKKNGADAVVCLGFAPIETIDEFIRLCEEYQMDSMLDMMSVKNSLLVLKKLKKPPNVVILHRGADETENREKLIPYYQIKQIQGALNNVLISVAGGDELSEIRSAIFNGVDILILWKAFYHPGAEISVLANKFLKEIQ